jgi:hypothetical protein
MSQSRPAEGGFGFLESCRLATAAPQQRSDTAPLGFGKRRRFRDKPSDVLFGGDVATLRSGGY